MISKVISASLNGIDGLPVQVEVYLAGGLPRFSIVGLPDAAVKESKDRVVAAVRNSGHDFPVRRVTVNLSPADVRKEGTSFDLPIAVGVLAASEVVKSEKLSRTLLVGELALDGHVRPVKGMLSVALAARDGGWDGLIFPLDNWDEASVVEGIELVPVSTLVETIHYLQGLWTPSSPKASAVIAPTEQDAPDLADVKGQLFAKRALEIAAAGGHNALMVGPPGSGKTMLAKRVPALLPPMSFEESLQTSKIHSVAGLLCRGKPLLSCRPFRHPHHTTSPIALVGGGSVPRPGEVSLAHNGVLFLDELPEFPRSVLEVLRQPLEDGRVTVSRAAAALTFPACFMLIGAMNPCPCGYLGHPERACVCTSSQVRRYRARVSGPFLDRMDLHVEVPPLKIAELTDDTPPSESSDVVRRRVAAARERQAKRFGGTGIFCNAQMSARQVKTFCAAGRPTQALLKSAATRLSLSARSFERVLKVARTIADLAGEERLGEEHVAESLGYRGLERSLS